MFSNINSSKGKEVRLPDFFAPILWSFNNILALDPNANQRTIIVQAINYGNLRHWGWISRYYGRQRVRDTITAVPITAFRPPALKLAAAVFDIKNFNYAPRSTDQSR